MDLGLKQTRSHRLGGASLRQTESTPTAVYSYHVCSREQITSHHTDGLGAVADSKSQAERSFSRTDRLNFNSSIQFSYVLRETDNLDRAGGLRAAADSKSTG